MDTELKVELGARGYTIGIGASIAPRLRKLRTRWREQGRRAAVVTDANVAQAQRAFIEAELAGLPIHVLAAGEGSKSLVRLEEVCEFLAGSGLDRQGVILALGGGVIGDLAGYAAASYLRGVAYVQLPTTLLAAVDSSVGGKTGVNLRAGKNLVGAFHQPEEVLIGTDFLDTLPERELAAGMAEVIKTGLLADAALLDLLEGTFELPAVIRRCCEVKARVVAADERETAARGGRALLNLGHTFAHAIENVAGYGGYLHGEAVAVGLVLAARLSQELGHLQGPEVLRVRALLRRHGLPVALRAPLAADKLTAAMKRDKKAKAGWPRFVVMEELGRAVTTEQATEELVERLWREAGAA